jgi:tRNA-Thr(GGU) m(6)t(6)A37 methyltransferase TsaA
MEKSYNIQIDQNYRSGLNELAGFSHLNVLWWGHLSKRLEGNELVIGQLFKNGPDNMGVFSTRSPHRPNPIQLSIVEINKLNIEEGIIEAPFIDAENGSPILDIKPYFPMDRVKTCRVPDWCQHWPKWFEGYLEFNWIDEINMSGQ